MINVFLLSIIFIIKLINLINLIRKKKSLLELVLLTNVSLHKKAKKKCMLFRLVNNNDDNDGKIQLIHLNAGSKKNVKIHFFIIEF